jgi:hypothetical protein
VATSHFYKGRLARVRGLNLSIQMLQDVLNSLKVSIYLKVKFTRISFLFTPKFFYLFLNLETIRTWQQGVCASKDIFVELQKRSRCAEVIRSCESKVS